MDSRDSVTYGVNGPAGTLEKLEFSVSGSQKGPEGNYSEEHSYKSSGSIDFSAIAGLEDFLEELLKGNDTITGTSQEGNELYGGAGDDTIKGNKGEDDLRGGTGDDTLDGGAGDDQLSGGEGNDTLKGGAGGDGLWGDTGNDTLDGGAGNDGLFGGEGNDTLKGGAGNDWLEGGAGVDVLNGGAGADYFGFQRGDSGLLDRALLDTVSDFKVKQGDKLVFNTYVAAEDVTIRLGKTDAAASYEDLLLTANESDSAVFVGYSKDDKKNGYAFVDFDGNGSMDMAIKLVVSPALRRSTRTASLMTMRSSH